MLRHPLGSIECLSPADRRIVQMVCAEKPSADIAAAFRCKPAALQTRFNRIYEKLGINGTRVSLVLWAFRSGFVKRRELWPEIWKDYDRMRAKELREAA